MAVGLKHLLRKDSCLFAHSRLFQVLQWHYLNHSRSRLGQRSLYGKPKASAPELFPPRLVLPENHGYTPTLSPQQVTSLLCANESTREAKIQGVNVVRGFDSNQLASNNPIEDRRSQATMLQTDGMLFGVFDGHGGCACAQAISERLLDYIAVTLLTPQKLEEYNRALRTDSAMEILHRHKNIYDYQADEMAHLYRSNLHRFVVESLSMTDFDSDPDHMTSNALTSAFRRLDNDISVEGLPQAGTVNLDSLEVALSGACATVALIQQLDLHVASVGDTRAVLGQLTEHGDWNAVPLSQDHNTENTEELNRVRSEHPLNETNFVIKNNRLLGQLIPLRAFGDMRYKWSIKELKNLIKLLDNTYAQTIMPMNYYTPPYLSCTPDITYHKLTPQDKFVILASDGLWENLSNEEVVRLVGEHMIGEDTVDHYSPESPSVKLGSINRDLAKRKATLALKSSDDNVATHIIRHTLGPDHKKISDMLTMPPEVVRYYRDDITVTVVFFDTTYIKKHSRPV